MREKKHQNVALSVDSALRSLKKSTAKAMPLNAIPAVFAAYGAAVSAKPIAMTEPMRK